MSGTLFDPGPPVVATNETLAKLSTTQRLTLRRQRAIALGKHPANGLPIDTSHTCGQCAHLNRIHWRSRHFLKCPYNRLGESHSEASDMRASWPACPHFVLAGEIAP